MIYRRLDSSDQETLRTITVDALLGVRSCGGSKSGGLGKWDKVTNSTAQPGRIASQGQLLLLPILVSDVRFWVPVT